MFVSDNRTVITPPLIVMVAEADSVPSTALSRAGKHYCLSVSSGEAYKPEGSQSCQKRTQTRKTL